MSKVVTKRQIRVNKILDFLRTYNGFVDNYGGSTKSIDLMCGCNRNLDAETLDGSILMQDIIKAYNHYVGGHLDDIYRSVCKNPDKRGVYQKVLLTDWKRAIRTFYSYGLYIPGLTENGAINALEKMWKIVK